MIVKSSFSRYDVQEGFQEHQSYSEPIIELSKQINSGQLVSCPKNNKKLRSSNKKQQPKLRFISIQRQNNFSPHYDYLKQEHSKNIHKSMTLNKQDKSFFRSKKTTKTPRPLAKFLPFENFNTSLVKTKRQSFTLIQARSEIGENLEFNQYNNLEVKMLKDNLINQGASLVFQDHPQTNSHGLFKKFLKITNSDNFLKSKYNASLLHKISSSYINPRNVFQPKLNHSTSKKPLQFVSDFESSNLDFVTQINPFEYDLYIKADTNTMGHQNWFYFKLLNNSEDKKNLFINVCNLKRGFRLIRRGQKIFYRLRKIHQTSVRTSIQTQDDQWSQWQKISQDVSVTPVYQNCSNDHNKKRRVFKLSFSADLLPQMQYEFSLLPPFTYSQMLKQVEKIEDTCKNVVVETLTFSHLGLCIPLLTFTNKESQNLRKDVILISARIHPGQTCGSYVAKGVLEKLAEQTEQNKDFLLNNIVKVIPMINPDGVVLGNFRTNYLGNDLNRSFNEQNEITFPQIFALKQLGRKLKQEYRQRFICLLDLHGHSSQKNIFVYGPNYDQNHRQFINSRFLPKTLSYLAEQFDYNKCTFTLEECKANTARGYFLKYLRTMAFTIESSYAIFDSNKYPENKNQDLKTQNWINFGKNIIKGLQIWNKSHNIKSTLLKNQENQKTKPTPNLQKIQGQHFLVIGRIKKQLTKESNLKKKITKRQSSQEDPQNSAEDTDGESQSEDIPFKQREKLEKKFIQANTNTNIFPRILRPAIIHPEVNPPMPLFSVSKINPSQNTPGKGSIIYARTKKNRYQNIKSVNVNNAYTEYLLKEVKGLEFLRPSVNLMKLSRKQSTLIQSSNIVLK